MQVSIRFFAVLRDRVGIPQASLELSPGASVEAATALICERFPQIASLLPRVAVAVNQSYVDRTMVLHDGDELALIPPVSGG